MEKIGSFLLGCFAGVASVVAAAVIVDACQGIDTVFEETDVVGELEAVDTSETQEVC